MKQARRRRGRGRLLDIPRSISAGALVMASVAVGCAATPSEGRSALVRRATLVQVGEASEGAPGSDAVPRRTLAFRDNDGALEALDVEARSFVPRWREGAALVDVQGRLYEVHPGGGRRMLAADASGSLAASEDGARLAFVAASGITGQLLVHDGEEALTLASGLASAGVLRFSDEGEGVYFVGARPGGVVGVWFAEPGAEPRCLSNCALRTGEPWGDRFVPPPTEASAIEERPGELVWTDPDGAEHRAPR